jgi:hypothetical protein
MLSAAAAPTEPALDGLKDIACHLEALILECRGVRIEVSTFSVWRAARRRRDPLPTWRSWNGRRLAVPSKVRAWFLRQGDAQVEMFGPQGAQ